MNEEILKTSGTVMDVKRFAVHDGPGIRTTFFLKGCPLRCRWCHNPEGLSPEPQLAYYAHKCRNCGGCASVCPAGAHTFENGVHRFDREKCRNCGKCELWCPAAALKLYGRPMTVAEALKTAREDVIFYADSKGGVTLSGGEPLLQPLFARDLLAACRNDGIHTALDTSCFAEREVLDEVIPFTDMFLVDFKHPDPEEHKRLTGRSNDLIRANLRHLSDVGARIEIRIPLVPGCNDAPEVLTEAGKFLGGLNVEAVRLLPYHPQAETKYAALDMTYRLPDAVPPESEKLESAAGILRGFGLKVLI